MDLMALNRYRLHLSMHPSIQFIVSKDLYLALSLLMAVKSGWTVPGLNLFGWDLPLWSLNFPLGCTPNSVPIVFFGFSWGFLRIIAINTHYIGLI